MLTASWKKSSYSDSKLLNLHSIMWSNVSSVGETWMQVKCVYVSNWRKTPKHLSEFMYKMLIQLQSTSCSGVFYSTTPNAIQPLDMLHFDSEAWHHFFLTGKSCKFYLSLSQNYYYVVLHIAIICSWMEQV